MPVETPSLFATVIQEHLELKRRNAALQHEMPIQKYMADDPFQNHPLFKSEQQARVEDTMDGTQSIVDQPTSLDWPSSPDASPDAFLDTNPEQTEEAIPAVTDDATEEASDEGLWSRSRDFDWGD